MFLNLMTQNFPCMKLFWQEQEKYINSSSSTAIRYHPTIIKFCFNLEGGSSSGYKDLYYDSTAASGLLVLLSLRTLRESIKPTRRFNPDVINNIFLTSQQLLLFLKLKGML